MAQYNFSNTLNAVPTIWLKLCIYNNLCNWGHFALALAKNFLGQCMRQFDIT